MFRRDGMCLAPTALCYRRAWGTALGIEDTLSPALKARLNNGGNHNHATASWQTAKLIRAFSARRDFYSIPGTLPQA
jgi:hypothetical protein